MSKPKVTECWAAIETWLQAHVPDAIPLLPAPASDAAMDSAEETLGYRIPREVREFLSIHNGSGNLWLHDRGEFMSLDTILEHWDMEFDLWGDGENDDQASPQGPIKKKWFTRKWLPILDARTGDCVCVDLDPAKGGKRGQLFSWLHDYGPVEVISPSFTSLLNEFVKELAAGFYVPEIDQAGKPYLSYSAR